MPATTQQTPAVSVAVFDHGTVDLHRLELAERAPGDIDVLITTAAICGSDLHTVLGHRDTPERTALGHEGVGQISAVDDGTVDARGTPLHVGDKVALAMMSSCGTCDRCRSGLTMKCRTILKYGHASVTTPPFATGMLASRVRLTPTVPLLRLPPNVDDMIMVSAGCAVATAAAVVSAAQPSAGEPALVFGAGAVGYYCAAMLMTLGCAVSVRDPSPERLAAVRTTGARTEPDEDEARYPIVVEASGSPDAFAEGLGSVEVGGRLVAAGSVSPGSSTVTHDPALVVTRRLTITGVHNYTADDFRRGVDWLLAHGEGFNVAQLVSPPLPLRQIHEAFALMKQGRYARVVVRPD